MKQQQMGTINLQVPTSWNQLTAGQVLHVSRLFLLNLSLHNFRVRAFCYFAGIRPFNPPKKWVLSKKHDPESSHHFFLLGRKSFTIEEQEFLWFLKSMDFLTADSSLTENKFPRLRFLCHHLEGPRRKCYNLTLLEFIHAEKCLFAFHASNHGNGKRQITYLNQLCAVLYRPSRQKPFNEESYIRQSNRFRFFSMGKRYAIYMFYAGCRNALFNAYPSIFGSSVSSEPPNPVENIRKIMYQLTSGDITKIKEVERTPVWEAFSYLQQLIEESETKKQKYVP